MAMKEEHLKKVKTIAKEVIDLIDEMHNYEAIIRKTGDQAYKSGKHRAAVTRRSLDLSRALAEMRNR